MYAWSARFELAYVYISERAAADDELSGGHYHAVSAFIVGNKITTTVRQSGSADQTTLTIAVETYYFDRRSYTIEMKESVNDSRCALPLCSHRGTTSGFLITSCHD